jgi:hypothetical protein
MNTEKLCAVFDALLARGAVAVELTLVSGEVVGLKCSFRPKPIIEPRLQRLPQPSTEDAAPPPKPLPAGLGYSGVR